VINAVWISISDPVEFFSKSSPIGSGSELQSPVGSLSGNRIMFNTVLHQAKPVLPDVLFFRRIWLFLYLFAGVKRNFWPLRNFWTIIVCQVFCFSEWRNKVWHLLVWCVLCNL